MPGKINDMTAAKSTLTTVEHRRIAKAAEEAIRLIQEDAAIALKAQKEEAALQLKVLAEAAAVALKTASPNNGMSDADQRALITLIADVKNLDKTFSEKFRDLNFNLTTQISDLKNNTTARVDELEKTRLKICDSYLVLHKEGVEKQLLSHENRITSDHDNITRIKTLGVLLLILLGIAEFLAGKFL